MSRANICDTETYTTAAGIVGKCSVLCFNLISGSDKDSLHNANCKLLCEGCYTYHATKANRDTSILPAFTYMTTVNPTTALLPPISEITLTVGEIVGIILASAIVAIVLQDILLILAWKKSERFWKFLETRLGRTQTADPEGQPEEVQQNFEDPPDAEGRQGVNIQQEREINQNLVNPARVPGTPPRQPEQPEPEPSTPSTDDDSHAEETTRLVPPHPAQKQQPQVSNGGIRGDGAAPDGTDGDAMLDGIASARPIEETADSSLRKECTDSFIGAQTGVPDSRDLHSGYDSLRGKRNQFREGHHSGTHALEEVSRDPKLACDPSAAFSDSLLNNHLRENGPNMPKQATNEQKRKECTDSFVADSTMKGTRLSMDSYFGEQSRDGARAFQLSRIPQNGTTETEEVPESDEETQIKVPYGGVSDETQIKVPYSGVSDEGAAPDETDGDAMQNGIEGARPIEEAADGSFRKECTDSFICTLNGVPTGQCS